MQPVLRKRLKILIILCSGLELSHNINATSPANTQRLTRTFSAVQQYCLTLKMQATRPFETSGTASHPTRTEQSATPLTEPEITQK